jgi:hypothetical protein
MQLFHNEGEVLTCQVMECSYNDREICHADEISVGGNHATCDTFTTAGVANRQDDMGSVARCDILQCSFNDQQACNASGITVGHHESHADCLTYRP